MTDDAVYQLLLCISLLQIISPVVENMDSTFPLEQKMLTSQDKLSQLCH